MSEDAGKGEGGKGEAGKGEGKNKQSSKWKSKWFVFFLIALLAGSVYYFFYYTPGPPNSQAPPDNDKVLELYDSEKSWAERKNIIDLYQKSLNFSEFEVENYLIELEKLNRAKELDIRLAGRKAAFYARDRGEDKKRIETEKKEAEKKERTRIETEEKRLKTLLDEAIEDVKRMKKKIGDARKDLVHSKDQTEASKK